MRIMFDTNIIVSSVLFPESKLAYSVLEISDSYRLVLCDRIINELRNVIQRKFPDKTLVCERFLRKLDFARIQFEKNMDDYSAGQKKKVLLAASLCEEAHVYIWDEPLNYIDVISRMQIEELIIKFKPTMIFVEHDRAFCDNVATKTIMLKKPM